MIRASTLPALGIALLVAALGGCDDTAPTGSRDIGTPDVIGPMLCPATGEPVQPEICDTRDNDCDGTPDEGYNTQTDSENCGRCGNICAFGNVDSACANGRCVAVGGCPRGTYDTNNDLTDGCEGRCEAEPTDELCDDIDNDCDGRVDENFDRNVSVLNCGTCGNVCQFDNAQPFCDGGRCRISACDPGWGDLDGVASNGCEAPCNPPNPGVERCDGEDNDCDGRVDENFDRQTNPEHCGMCSNRCGFANATARCSAGECVLSQCDPGFVDRDDDLDNGCEARCTPIGDGAEVCDGREDEDCDGAIDEDWDKLTDPQNCGGCGEVDPEAHICNLPNTMPTCVDGACTTDRCVVGFVDADGILENGCEEVCNVENEGVEICDGVDQDCNGVVDDGFDLTNDPANCGRCGNACDFDNATGACELGRCVLRPDACDPGYVDADQDPLTGCEYACVPTGPERCDGGGVDEDCDTHVDEGYDTLTELEHCGGCNQLCAPDNAIAVCSNGTCDIAGCRSDWFDANGDVADGCEVECPFAVPTPEACDELDNDCDGSIDEDFDTQSDLEHCGACGNVCTFPNGRLTCAAGVCQVDGCLDGWFDVNGDPADGCEVPCVRSNGGVEVCDTLDNDCDGRVDEGTDLQNDSTNCGVCGNVCAYDNAQGACVAGRCRLERCNPGWADANQSLADGCEFVCPNPSDGELCNESDDDCDGRTDEGFDLLTDIDHCGGCNQACEMPNAIPLCNGGRCEIVGCVDDYFDLDREPMNGCECQRTNRGIEICDGIDNDCNGIVDDPERLVAPIEAACKTRGVCAGVQPVCVDAEWRCDYPVTYEDPEEDSCDGLDNNCNGSIDESFPDLGQPCSDGQGICRVTGRRACEPNGRETGCDAQADGTRSRPEQCNGLDDDCDGFVDEGSDQLVTVPAGGGVAAFTIYAYEASRTDADAGGPGQSFARACSKPGVQPWVDVDHDTAAAACAAAGLRLCTGGEWNRACAGNANQSYPYGNVYQPDRCNGVDYDTDPATPGNQDDVIATGARPGCARDLGGGPVYDLSGNVWEWTSQQPAGVPDGSARILRGGSAGNLDGGLTCQFQNATPAGAFRANIGFRCCGPPP